MVAKCNEWKDGDGDEVEEVREYLVLLGNVLGCSNHPIGKEH